MTKKKRKTESDENDCDLPFVSAIVPIYNGASSVKKLIEALECQTYPNSRYEVICVDDGSTDNTADVIESYSFTKCIRQSNSGSYSARNRGYSESSGEILAFTDADCIPDVNWLVEGTRPIINNRADLVAGKVELIVRNPLSAIELKNLNCGIRQKYFAQNCGFGATANLFVSREYMETVNGFDSRLYSGGDYEFCHLAQDAGARFKYSSSAIVRHPTRRTLISLVKMISRISRGKVYIWPSLRNLGIWSLSGNSGLEIAEFRNFSLRLKIRYVFLHIITEIIRVSAFLYEYVKVYISNLYSQRFLKRKLRISCISSEDNCNL